MITTINKDILTVDKGVIVHSVNCIGAVGGLAGAIGSKWPVNAGEYRSHVRSQKSPITLLGSIFEVNVAHNLIVANLFGQYNVGTGKQQTEYAALISGFKTIANTCFEGNDEEILNDGWSEFGFNIERKFKNILKDVYIPYKIGCGLGGADWNHVEEILHKVFDKSLKNVYICRHEF
jgi:O-acetyl-ADP-ribose deacetylase (regulator of RNase III)